MKRKTQQQQVVFFSSSSTKDRFITELNVRQLLCAFIIKFVVVDSVSRQRFRFNMSMDDEMKRDGSKLSISNVINQRKKHDTNGFCISPRDSVMRSARQIVGLQISSRKKLLS